MRYKLKCDTCGATAWVRGSYESDTNATCLDENDVPEWELNEEVLEATFECQHDNFTIVDEDTDDDDYGGAY